MVECYKLSVAVDTKLLCARDGRGTYVASQPGSYSVSHKTSWIMILANGATEFASV